MYSLLVIKLTLLVIMNVNLACQLDCCVRIIVASFQYYHTSPYLHFILMKNLTLNDMKAPCLSSLGSMNSEAYIWIESISFMYARSTLYSR